MRASVLGVSLWGSGLEGWEASRAVLAGLAPRVARDSPPPAPAMLSATERRRASLVVRLALHVAQEASAMSGLPPGALRSVFGTSNGDGAVVHAILQSLAAGDGQVSPTQFHNSVHNAAAGYWTIGAGSRQPATCIGCHDATAGMALLTAAAELHVERAPVLLCVYDAAMPEPLHRKRPTEGGFAAALVLSPAGTGGIAEIAVRFSPGPPAPAQWEACAPSRANAAARMLPLLRAFARGQPATVPLAVLDGHVLVTVFPCSTAGGSPR